MGDLKVDQDAGELATAIRVNLYRHAPDMPSYPEGIVPKVVKPYLEKAFAAGREQGLREAAEVARTCNLITSNHAAYTIGATIEALLSEKPA